MKNIQLYLSMLVVALSLGTAWAIRGQFGHEHGAAWAGGIGCLSLILVAKRSDWYSRFFSIMMAGALGWGLGGIMSYGIVVGYGRADDFANAYYGLMMLFVIGGLYGYIGGGLFGLALSDTTKNPVKWVNLIVEMLAGAFLFYYFIITEFEWFMTPPRSEMWAACFGAAVALTWFMVRHQRNSALRVAVFSGLGGGFGFAFGNFLQVLGSVSGIKFNFWNVMEYTLGFFGGLGMSYGTLTSSWEPLESSQKKNSQLFPLLMVVLIIPFTVWQQNFETKRVYEMLTKLNVLEGSPLFGITEWIGLGLILLFTLIWLYKYYFSQPAKVAYSYKAILTFFIGHLSLYIVLSWVITGAFVSTYRPEQYLYALNLVVILLLINKTQPSFADHQIGLKKWSFNVAGVAVFIALLALIAINSHEELKGAQKRFGAEPVEEAAK
ncbi:photosystem II biosynthesis protein [Emticicia fontis]